MNSNDSNSSIHSNNRQSEAVAAAVTETDCQRSIQGIFIITLFIHGFWKSQYLYIPVLGPPKSGQVLLSMRFSKRSSRTLRREIRSPPVSQSLVSGLHLPRV